MPSAPESLPAAAPALAAPPDPAGDSAAYQPARERTGGAPEPRRRACHGAGLGGDLSRGMRPGGPMDSGKFRLVTRSDFDGLASAVLLRDLDLIDDVRLVHPTDMQDGPIEIGARDILTDRKSVV